MTNAISAGATSSAGGGDSGTQNHRGGRGSGGSDWEELSALHWADSSRVDPLLLGNVTCTCTCAPSAGAGAGAGAGASVGGNTPLPSSVAGGGAGDASQEVERRYIAACEALEYLEAQTQQPGMGEGGRRGGGGGGGESMSLDQPAHAYSAVNVNSAADADSGGGKEAGLGLGLHGGTHAREMAHSSTSELYSLPLSLQKLAFHASKLATELLPEEQQPATHTSGAFVVVGSPQDGSSYPEDGGEAAMLSTRRELLRLYKGVRGQEHFLGLNGQPTGLNGQPTGLN